MRSPNSIREHLSATDRIALATSFHEKHQDALLDITPKKFVEMIVDRIWIEISRNIHGRKDGVAFSDVTLEFQRWVDKETHLAQEKIPVLVANHDQYLALRHQIIEEVAARAAFLFSRWKGDVSPPLHTDSDVFLRSSIWPRVAPCIPKAAKRFRITAANYQEALTMLSSVTYVTKKGVEVCNETIGGEFELEEFPEIWEICKLRHIPNTSVTFS